MGWRPSPRLYHGSATSSDMRRDPTAPLQPKLLRLGAASSDSGRCCSMYQARAERMLAHTDPTNIVAWSKV